MKTLSGVLHTFDRFWFRPADPRNLAVCRVAFIAWLFVWYVNHDFSYVSEFPAAFWKPQFLLKLFGLDVMPPLSVVLGAKLVFF